MVVKRISAQETRPLRQQVLRPHQRAEELIYPGDDDPDALHLGAYEGDRLVGILSACREMPETGEPHAWRLRGMATLPDVRGAGYGGKLLRAAIGYVATQGCTYLWCNARTPVIGFYEHYDFERRGEEFEPPHIGPHYFVWRTVTPEDARWISELDA